MRWRERSRFIRLWRLWRTRNPRTFREKVRYKMLRDHRDLVVTFADKVAVRDYVAARIGAEHLPSVYAILEDPAALAALELPDRVVIKPSHGSGAAIVISPTAPDDTHLPVPDWSWVYRRVTPDHAAVEDLIPICRHWLSRLYGQGPNREWVYGRVPRRIIVEELLTGPDGAPPPDYKFFVYHGRCRFVQVDGGRFGHRTQDFFLRDWTHLPMSGGPPWADPEPPPPATLAQMITIAETLGEETDFVRVDLYDIDGRPVFGELTSFPAGGDSPFYPEAWNEVFGAPWTVPAMYA